MLDGTSFFLMGDPIRTQYVLNPRHETPNPTKQAVERGYQEGYDLEQALRWCWQIARGLWTLHAADIGFASLSLRHVLLTAPDGDVRLSGFDALVGGEEGRGQGQGEEEGAQQDSRKGLWDLGRVLHMTLTCSTDREDDRDYYRLGRKDAGRSAAPMLPAAGAVATAAARRRSGLGGGSGSGGVGVAAAPRPFLAAIPAPALPLLLGLLASTPSYAMPLGLALEALAELVGVDAGADAALEARRRTLRPAEERWWALVQEQEDADGGEEVWGGGSGVVERKASGGAGPREARLALAQACLALGEEWDRQGKAYRAIELYVDAAAFAGEAANGQQEQQPSLLRTQAGGVETEAWGRIADIRQGQGQHGAALRVLRRLVARYEHETRACRELYEHERAQATLDAITPPSSSSTLAAVAGWQQGPEEQQQRRRRRRKGSNGAGDQRQPLPDLAAWRGVVAGQQWAEAAEKLAGARVRLAASLRELGEGKEALAQLNTAQRDLQQAGGAASAASVGVGGGGAAEGAINSVAMVRVLTGKAVMYRQRKSYLQALEMYEAALELRRRVVAREDPELAGLLVGMAEVYAEKGDSDVALGMLIQAYKRMTEAPQAVAAGGGGSRAVSAVGSGVGGEADRLLMASTLERIGRLFSQRGQLDDALMCLRAAHERYQGRGQGKQEQQMQQAWQTRPAVGHTLAAMADLYERKEDWRAAGQMHARTLDVRRAVLSPTSPLLADSLYGLGNAHQRLKAPRAALQAYEEALAIRRTALQAANGNGNGNGGGSGAIVALGDVLVNMSRPLKALHRDGEAVARLQEAREVYTQQAGLKADNPRVRTVNDNLRVLGALAAAKAGNGSGSGTGVSGSGGDRRERLLQHHARGTSSQGKPAAPAGAKKKSSGCVVS